MIFLTYPSYFPQSLGNKVILQCTDENEFPGGKFLEPSSFPEELNCIGVDEFRRNVQELNQLIENGVPSRFAWFCGFCCFSFCCCCLGPCLLDLAHQSVEEKVKEYLKRLNSNALYLENGIEWILCKIKDASGFPSPKYWIELSMDPRKRTSLCSNEEVQAIQQKLFSTEDELEQTKHHCDILQEKVLELTKHEISNDCKYMPLIKSASIHKKEGEQEELMAYMSDDEHQKGGRIVSSLIPPFIHIDAYSKKKVVKLEHCANKEREQICEVVGLDKGTRSDVELTEEGDEDEGDEEMLLRPLKQANSENKMKKSKGKKNKGKMKENKGKLRKNKDEKKSNADRQRGLFETYLQRDVDDKDSGVEGNELLMSHWNSGVWRNYKELQRAYNALVLQSRFLHNEMSRIFKEKKSSRREIEELKESHMCKICKICNTETVIYPCGHAVLCHSCSASYEATVKKSSFVCPICRTPIKKIIKMYTV